MKYTFLFLLLLVLPSIAAHSIETKYVIKSDAGYNIKFSTEPEFPVAGKETHLDFAIWDDAGKTVTEAALKLAVQQQEREKDMEIILEAVEHGEHYETVYTFPKAGQYLLVPSVNEKPLQIQFTIVVEHFGLNGVLQLSTVLFFLLVLLGLMIRDLQKQQKQPRGDTV